MTFSNISISPIDPGEFENAIEEASTNTVGSMEIFLILLFSILSIIGVVGNVLVITVVLKVRGMKTPTNCYLVSLAASDTLFFFASMPHEMMYLIGNGDHYIFGSIGCALLTYLPYLAMNTSSLSITAFTVERFIGICYPYRARTMCTVKRAKLIICMLWIVSIIYHSQWLFLAAVVEDKYGTACSFRLERNDLSYKIVFLADFFFLYVVPMLLDIIIYVKIGITLSQCSDKIKKSVKPLSMKTEATHANVTMIPATNTTTTVTTKLSVSGYTGRDSHISGKRNSSKGRNQVVKMLALVVAVFAICWLPYRGMVMYNSFVSAEKHWSPDWYINLAKTLIFINCAINPILYNLMSARFRAAFRSLLSKRKRSTYQTTAPISARHRLTTLDALSSQQEPKSPLISAGASTP
ncbi:unnamed protein product [Caenorhabditis angaria]|uniref:Thyrotropin-releasing hormone receptor n=1 Tax=Caenorhabditis angaria TaxID=860376 RepID=A0A9P1MV97_9PELO|nr:unnamed protein product [Caenorhabditis angaria]